MPKDNKDDLCLEDARTDGSYCNMLVELVFDILSERLWTSPFTNYQVLGQSVMMPMEDRSTTQQYCSIDTTCTGEHITSEKQTIRTIDATCTGEHVTSDQQTVRSIDTTCTGEHSTADQPTVRTNDSTTSNEDTALTIERLESRVEEDAQPSYPDYSDINEPDSNGLRIEVLGSYNDTSKQMRFNVLLVMKNTATDEYWTSFTEAIDDRFNKDGFETSCECCVVYEPETAENDAHIRAEQSEITARENVFQTMVSCEPVSVDIGRNEEEMQTYATDYLYISKKDIVIIHSEDDIVRAANFKESIEKLCDNKLIPGVTVDLQQHIDAGMQAIGSLYTLHDRYRCILVFVTDAFQSDAYKKFHSECLLVFVLDAGGDKLNRVVPVWVDTTRGTCKIPYLKTLNGIAYTGKTSNFFEELMLKTVKHFREMIK